MEKINIENQELQLALDFVRYTNQNIFLTGKAGTGKTTFLKNLKNNTHKRMIVVAPTGVAAINAGGVTIHSFFQLPFNPIIPGANDEAFYRFRSAKINIIRSMDLLIIDEISMVRADLLDGIDTVLRKFKNRNLPFGGVQLLMIGDLQQLAPVVKDNEWELLKQHYDTCFFFSSIALKKAGFTGIELKHIYRQSDEKFISLLNRIRTNTADKQVIAEINKRYIPGFKPKDDEKYITMTTHNYQAKAINQEKLVELPNRAYSFKASIKGEFPEYMYPTEPVLELKRGAQVMFVKNDSSSDKRFYNGKIGTIISINPDNIEVRCPGDTESILTTHEKWDNVSYSLNATTLEIEEEVLGSFEQYPLKLAWAITIHKSQGLTFDKTIINARQSFAPGQVYVALSRCKSLEGIVLSTPIDTSSIHVDEDVDDFIEGIEQNQPDGSTLKELRYIYQKQLIKELFDFNLCQRLIGYMLKLCREQGSLLLGDLNSVLLTMINPLKSEMIEVAEKFEAQTDRLLTDNPDIEKNEIFQERIRKATAYYLEKLNTIVIEPLESASFETDNKTVRKSFQVGMENLKKEVALKESTLQSCIDGFSIQSYLKARALASISFDSKKTKTGKSFSSNPVFYRRLVEWRTEKAIELVTDTSRIIRQKTLIAIADQLPATRLDLKNISGVGETKLRQFGKELLEMIIIYRREKGMDLPLEPEKEVESVVLDSKHQSLELFKSGKTIDDIAKERKMTTSTIEGHLAHFVSIGELSIDKVLDADKKQAIQKFVESHLYMSLSEIKSAMGSNYSYSDIRFVINHLKYNGLIAEY